MSAEQQQVLDRLRMSQTELSDSWVDYWFSYSNMSTWQFWCNLLFLIVPLVVVWLRIDPKRIFWIGFYGFNIHVWFTYFDLFGTRNGLWDYPYKAIPYAPVNFALDVSFVPVTFMLVYQWLLNRKKNYYLYMTGLCAVFAFALKPILSALELFQLYERTTYLHLFVYYLVIAFLSKWITDLFILKHNRQSGETGPFHWRMKLHRREKAR